MHGRERQDPEKPLLGLHGALDLPRRERPVALDDDPVDVDLPPLVDPEDQPEVAFGRPLGPWRDGDSEEAVVLVLLPDRLLGPLHLDRVVQHADPEGSLLP